MKSKEKTENDVESYTHKKSKRTNNPQVGQIKHVDISDEGTKQYKHDPHIDPCLSWAGKEESVSFDVETVSIHVHERIDSKAIIESMQKGSMKKSRMSLFSFIDEDVPDWKTNEFYSHKNNWSNRLITGDSLLVMNSLLEKEQMGGKVQTIYIDPPYGINYKSNFQPYTAQTDVKDSDEDLSSEPEQIRAFRDTWELGIHSYLTYLRDRLLLARELLNDSGSCFLQIGSQNVHFLGVLMGEIFGFENRMPTITYTASGRATSKELADGSSYLLWYAKNKDNIKYRKLFESLTRKEIVEHFGWGVSFELPDGTTDKLTEEQRFDPDKYLPPEAKLYRRMPLVSQHKSNTGRSEPYEFEGRTFSCPPDMQWAISKEGLDHLAKIGRIEAKKGQKSIRYKEYEDEIPGKEIDNNWSSKMAPKNKVYVVQTAHKVIERVILMTSDPGDLVFDPTCGSGTTAFVAEKWGRRWITCDTSRVAINIAKERMMTSQYDYYKLLHPKEGVDSGFQYKSIKTVTAAILGYKKPLKEEILYDQPIKEKINRVTGPFTVEAVPSIVVKSVDEVIQDENVSETVENPRTTSSVKNQEWHDQLYNAGIRGKQGDRIKFNRLEPKSGTKWIHAEGETTDSKLVVVSFGPDSAPLSQTQLDNVLDEAASLFPKPDIIIFAAFHFDPEAAKRIDEQISKITLLKVKMAEDLLTEDLKRNTRTNDTFWLIGQPDVQLNSKGDQYTISVHGFDYYNPNSGELESGNANKIVMWMLDTDYDGKSIFPNQVFFPMAGKNGKWMEVLSKNLKARIDADEIMKISGTESFPFKSGERKKVAVKIIDDRGIESIKIMEIDDEK